ncbi:MAG: hypothetical protein DRI46_12770 [Chloroflexi bacterium]|nr:MAG: hypothetical protein DRI46_12770 [Chloroflexota bacterium]
MKRGGFMRLTYVSAKFVHPLLPSLKHVNDREIPFLVADKKYGHLQTNTFVFEAEVVYITVNISF